MEAPDITDEFKIAFWNHISVRMGIGIFVVTAAIFALAGIQIHRQEEQKAMEKHVAEVHRHAASVADLLSARMLAGGGKSVWVDISREAGNVASLIDAARIVVLNQEGLVKAGTDRLSYEDKIETRGNPNCPKCDSRQLSDFPATAVLASPDGMRRLRVVTPILKQESCNSCHRESGGVLGLIAVDFDLSSLDRSESDRGKRMLLIGLLSCVVLIGLVDLLLRRWIYRPIAVINKAAQEIARGHHQARVPVIRNDELGAFAVQFNHMAKQVAQQFEHIEIANMESGLFYTLVVEVSKNLEISDMANCVFKVLRESLDPSILAVFINEADERWVCYAGRGDTECEFVAGDGDLVEAFALNDPRIARAIRDVPGDMIDRALFAMTLQVGNAPGQFAFAMPFVYDQRLIGIVVCSMQKNHMMLTPRLLNNLSAQLALAAGNSRNYMGSIIDPLTRLRNKRYGMMRLDEETYKARRNLGAYALLMVDIDHFKRVNDSYGHPAGDRVLKEVARRIAGMLRKSDIAVRYGGEEFMIIVTSDDGGALEVFGERMRKVVADSPIQVHPGGTSIPVTISVGGTRFYPDKDDGSAMIDRADRALYRAKESGRNRVEIDV